MWWPSAKRMNPVRSAPRSSGLVDLLRRSRARGLDHTNAGRLAAGRLEDDAVSAATVLHVRTYFVSTFGCQMNAHDSERIKGMLESLGLGEARSQDEADVVVFNTCTIREKPDTKLSAYLGDAGARKRENPNLVIAVGGCFAEAQQERIFD